VDGAVSTEAVVATVVVAVGGESPPRATGVATTAAAVATHAAATKPHDAATWLRKRSFKLLLRVPNLVSGE